MLLSIWKDKPFSKKSGREHYTAVLSFLLLLI